MAPFDGSVVKYEALAHYLTLKYKFGVADRTQILDFLGLFGDVNNGGEVKNLGLENIDIKITINMSDAEK